MTLLPEWRDVRRLLVMRPDNIGDVVIASATLRAIREAWPDAHITLLASGAGAQVAPMLPWIDDLIVARAVWQDIGGLPFDPARESAFIAELAARSFDAAILLTSFSQSPHAPAAACLLAGIPLRLGESLEDGAGLITHTPATPTPIAAHQAERNLRLIEAIGVRVTDRDLSLVIGLDAHATAQAWRDQAKVGEYIVLAPFASCSARTYPPDRAALAARAIAERHGLHVVLCGGPNDRARAVPLLDLLGPVGRDAVDATDIATYAALIDAAALVVTSNTSALHLADTCRTPVLVGYSGTELESQWTPRVAPHRLLRRPTPCSPCHLLECPIGIPCLDISADEMITSGLDLLDEVQRATPHRVKAKTLSDIYNPADRGEPIACRGIMTIDPDLE